MKIGILTFHRAHNYGAALQLYALAHHLTALGHEVVVIDYRSKAIEKGYKIFDWRKVIAKNPRRLIAKNRAYFSTLAARKARHRAFRDFMHENFTLFDYSNISQLDMVVIGSDQVWNPQIAGGYDVPYFGDFGGRSTPRMVTYGASAGWAEGQLECEIFKNVLSRFSHLSVREESLKGILQPLTLVPISVVVDPTLLLSKDEWSEIAVKPKSVPEKFVLVYQIALSDKILSMARTIADELGTEVIEIDGYIRSKDSEKHRSACSVEEFLWYFQSAEFVVTSSFHGTVFSIINSVPFYSVEVGGKGNGRITSLLSQLNLESRIVAEGSSIDATPINYEATAEKFEAIIASSKAFLSEKL